MRSVNGKFANGMRLYLHMLPCPIFPSQYEVEKCSTVSTVLTAVVISKQMRTDGIS